MSDDDDNGGDFQEFKGSPDPSEGGITTNEIITSHTNGLVEFELFFPVFIFNK